MNILLAGVIGLIIGAALQSAVYNVAERRQRHIRARIVALLRVEGTLYVDEIVCGVRGARADVLTALRRLGDDDVLVPISDGEVLSGTRTVTRLKWRLFDRRLDS